MNKQLSLKSLQFRIQLTHKKTINRLLFVEIQFTIKLKEWTNGY